MNSPEIRSDEDLANLYSQGDHNAGEALAQRYVAGVYDFAIRATLDPRVAETATTGSMRRIGEEFANRPDTLSFGSWVYGLARDEALNRLHQHAQSDESGEVARSDSLAHVDLRFIQTELPTVPPQAAAWAWQAVRGQRPRDYSILDLLLRRKMTPEEVGEVAALSHNGVYAVLGRLRGVFEEAYTAAALFELGREVCSDLEELLSDQPVLGPAVRRTIGRHVEGCAICSETRQGLPPAAELFASFTNVDLPQDLMQGLRSTLFATLQPDTTPDAGTEATEAADAEVEVDPGRGMTEVESPEEAPTSARQTSFEDSFAAQAVDAEPGPETFEPMAFEPETAELDFAEPEVAEANTEIEADAAANVAPPTDEDEVDQPTGLSASRLPLEAALPAAASTFDGPDWQRGGGIPPEGPEPPDTGWSDGERSKRYLLYAGFVAISLFAAYLGFAVGDSLQNGSTSSLPPLPTPDGLSQAQACSTVPVRMDVGTSLNLTFAAVPTDFQVSNIIVIPETTGASAENVRTLGQADQSVLFVATSFPDSAGRSNQYQLVVTFAQGEQTTTAQCVVIVQGGAAPQPTEPTEPTATPTIAVVEPTTPPVVAPTETSTPEPDPETPTPLPTSTPTVTGTPPTPTPTQILPPTVAPESTVTPTSTVTGTPTQIPIPTPAP